MSVSPQEEVRDLYDTTAGPYNAMMEQEIRLPLYNRVLSELATAALHVPGSILDTSCGGGHMLQRIAREYLPGREIIGVDLSPEMVQASRDRLGDAATIFEADMSSLTKVPDSACSAVISFFAIHHVDWEGLSGCLDEWQRILTPGGHLFLAAWEGSGNIDYGDSSNIIARRYTEAELRQAALRSGFQVERHSVEPVDDMEMDAVHLVAAKPGCP